jgi:hypothetical protein
MTIEAYPLQWPEGWSRTQSWKRQSGKFDTTLGKARDGLLAEIKRLGGLHPVISSNLKLRQDGLPYAAQPKLDDPGIAVYFDYKAKPMCFACDRYSKQEANLRAIELTIAALRGIERWGASDMIERAFTGFAAIGHQQPEHWSDVLGVPRNATRDEIETEWRRLRSLHHPDKGGNPQTFQTVKEAYEAAIAP